MTDREKAPQFVFENVGSHGDIMPLLSIAAELVRRGHRCQLLGNEHFRAAALGQGVGFHANARERTHSAVPGSTVSYVYFKLDGAREYFGAPRAFDERTVVVNTHGLSATEPLAEAHGLRTVRLTLFPVRIKSLLSPPWPLGARACGPDGETFLKVTLPAMYRTAESHPEVLAKINGVRAELGLTPVRTVTYEREHVVAQAAMFPEWFGMPAKDWPEMECLGFPLPSSAEPLAERVLEFLARCPRPLVFTPGTGFGQPERFFDAAARCCSELGMPGIFLSPFLHADHRKLGDRIACFEHVELAGLLRHAALIVHHGGMGTTARALQAGIPQIISPVGFDQPDNGHRVEVLRAGRVVARDRLCGATLSAAVRELLTDSEVSSKLSGYRAALASPCAIERAADLLEDVAHNTPLPRRSIADVALAAAS
jgi:rhamnosyltransferase subunit B